MTAYRCYSWRCALLRPFAAGVATIAVALMPVDVWAGPLAGTIFDVSGDTISHDVESVSATFDATHMQLHATFYQDTLNPTDLAFIMFFDLDQNPATGLPSSGSISTGAEVGVSFNSLRHPTEVRIRDAALPVSFGVDTFSITVPLSALGDDGHANFGIVVGDPTSDLTFLGREFAPNGDMGRPLSTPTQFIPEPRSVILALLGLLCLIVGVVRAGGT
ncbi:MAG: hypothetical protein H0T51_25855 [Pirellulales bacterium]|nr:hypothetical protein [Pirellulales bacterium]